MYAHVIFKDKNGKTLTVPACIDALSRAKLISGDVKYVGTFWASGWEEAKLAFDEYFGFI